MIFLSSAFVVFMELRFQVAAIMEMPADSKEFMAIEKALLQQEGYADDDWDLNDGTQKAYKAAKLKRWNLDKIQVHFCTRTTDKKWEESIQANKQSTKGSADQLSSVMDYIGRRDPEQSSGSKEESKEDLAFNKFQNQLAVFAGQKSILAGISICG